MEICPLISNGNSVMRCHPSCALLTEKGCAIRVLADAKIQEQKETKNSDKT